ncbi:septal ring lytic transglycosylase RlpA family protein [Dactylosporangium fulvum]|uniref:septal ring lytic transglycosylase RlpA family protein n=1 Tax=Dactylosporangium fulvum TaxID=53359 RepID=UPI0029D41312|nr:septal ring lytic transglycosylase RlpA family protein [Dactylosporangium fulvum]
MSGKHSAERRRLLVPLIAGAVAVAALVGGAVATVNLSSDPKPTAAAGGIDASRSPDERADRGDRPVPSADPSESPQVVASASPSKSTTKSPTKSPTMSPSKKPSTSSAVTNTGTCQASYYASGSKTANGENFDPDGLTAAHKTLPFNTKVRVTNLANGKSVVVRINDRGPFVSGRCLDLARGAFVTIASVSSGVINARYEVLK